MMSRLKKQRPSKKELLEKLFFTMHVVQGRLEEERYLPPEMEEEMVKLKGALLRFHRAGVEYKLW